VENKWRQSQAEAAKRFGEHPTARVNAVLNALDDWKPISLSPVSGFGQ
jgi:hypothetical protein